MTAHIDQLTGQFEHLKESALGQIGAITDPIADLVAVPTDLLNTTRDCTPISPARPGAS